MIALVPVLYATAVIFTAIIVLTVAIMVKELRD